jgi:hypothetical protein
MEGQQYREEDGDSTKSQNSSSLWQTEHLQGSISVCNVNLLHIMVYWGFPAKFSQLGSKTNIATIWREVEDIKIGKKLLNLAFHCCCAV